MDAIPSTLAALSVPVDTLRHYGKNPRSGDVDTIVESLRINGQYRPVVVNKRTNEVLAGNHTLKAARQLGWTEIAATYVDVDEEQAARIVLVDNRSNDLATYDERALAALLSDLSALEGSGFDDAAQQELLDRVTDLPPPLPEPDALPERPPPTSKPGDVWLLGPHRVICGDSSDVAVLDALMMGASADLVWTDPPYGVAYQAKGHKAIANDELGVAELTDFLRETLGAALTASRPGACWYVAAPAGPPFLAFAVVLTEFGVWRQTISWVKNAIVLGHSDYHYQHEAILYGWSPGAPHQPPPDRKQSTVWEFPKPKANRDHPTQKPVALIEKSIANSTDRGDLVLDVFGGSGSTLIACHQQARVARLVELDAGYVDVICRRYQDATGVAPVLESTGEPHDFGG